MPLNFPRRVGGFGPAIPDGAGGARRLRRDRLRSLGELLYIGIGL